MCEKLWNFAFRGQSSDCDGATVDKESLTSNSGKSKNRSSSEVWQEEEKSTPVKYTPLELQYLDFKKEYPDTILLIQCGYKYRIFGEDAQVASKELGIGCFTYHNFQTSCIFHNRLFVHVRKLVARGFKVGVVRQTEYTALKASGESRNSLFKRKLDALYTQSTFIEAEISDFENLEIYEALPFSDGLVCITETLSSSKNFPVTIGIVAVNVSSGDVSYASFVDCPLRSRLENYLSVMRPVEFLLPMTTLTDTTELLIKNFIDTRAMTGCMMRMQKMDDEAFVFTNAVGKVSDFMENDETNTTHQEVVLNLDPSVICCLSPLISYLIDFNLEVLLKNPSHFKPLESVLKPMSYNPPAIRSLELFENLSDFQERGSLFWTMNFVRTIFGKKLLRRWILQPLVRLQDINERQAAVEEILNTKTSLWMVFDQTLLNLPDMERLLSASFHHRCTCSQFILLGKAFIEVRRCLLAMKEKMELEIGNFTLKNLAAQIINLTENIENLIANIDEEAARKEERCNIFRDYSMYPNVVRYQNEMNNIKRRLDALKMDISKILHLPKFEYSSVMGQNHLIEVRNPLMQYVPNEWCKISSTKLVSRFRSPEVECLCKELDMCTENLQISYNDAWRDFLNHFRKHFFQFKKAIECIATLDCLLSFAKLAKEKTYCRPTFSESANSKLHIMQGRNPIVCCLIGEKDQYVANDTCLTDEQHCMILTGPNMGGKSSYVRQVALIAILAQIGSYVPAESACLPLFDGIYVRMGAEDSLCMKCSTFKSEMEETSVILSSATSNSLVILDELGRGTSSHDGAAIAHATLLHLITMVKCYTLFVTHYPDVAYDLQARFPNYITTCHMSFYALPPTEDNVLVEDHVTFLYSVEKGIATTSYGINVARLAGIPDGILHRAKNKSHEMESRLKKVSY